MYQLSLTVHRANDHDRVVISFRAQPRTVDNEGEADVGGRSCV